MAARHGLAPKLRTLLLQANLSWTAGRLLLTAASFFVIPGYLVYLRSGRIFFGLVMGLLCGFALRTQRRQQVEELAAKTSVKLVFPLVFLVFPSLFVVALGPEAIIMWQSFKTVFIR